MNISKINKILIIRLSSLGDILLSTPLIRLLKKSYPHIEIDFLLRQRYSDVLRNNPYLNKLIAYDESLKDDINKNGYDLIIDLQNNLRSASLLRGLKTNVLKFNKRSIDKFLLVNFKINRMKEAPPIPVRYASVLENLKLDDGGTDLFTNKEPSVTPVMGIKYIGLAPGARHFTKRWPKEYYAELGNLLQKNGFTIIFFGGRDDMELCREIAEAVQGSLNLSFGDDILQTAADMKICSAVVCNDSGLMHTAAAAGVPVLSIFGSTVREFGFTPYNSSSLVLENKLLSCRPCSHIGRSRCPKGHFRCMLEITPAETYKKLMDLLS